MKTIFITALFSIYGIVMSGKSVIWHTEINAKNELLNAPVNVIMGYVEEEIPTDAKVLIRFEGAVGGSKGDGLIFAPQNAPQWISNHGHTMVLMEEGTQDTQSFSHHTISKLVKETKSFFALDHFWVFKNGTRHADIIN